MLHTDTGRMGGGSQAKEIVSKDTVISKWACRGMEGWEQTMGLR